MVELKRLPLVGGDESLEDIHQAGNTSLPLVEGDESMREQEAKKKEKSVPRMKG